jgi:hypothetical protein
MEWDCSAANRSIGFDLAAVPQQTRAASGCGTYPHTTSHLHCGRTGGATNFDPGCASCNPDTRAAYGGTDPAQRDPCLADCHTTNGCSSTHDADGDAAAPSASSQTPAHELTRVWDAGLFVVAARSGQP